MEFVQKGIQHSQKAISSLEVGIFQGTDMVAGGVGARRG